MEEVSFLPLFIVVGLAFLVPLLVSRVRRAQIPCVVGEVLAGIVVGQSVLGLVGHDTVLQVLSILGFAYLMFLSGLEVDYEALLPRRNGQRQTWRDRLGHPLSLGTVALRRIRPNWTSGAPLPSPWPSSCWPGAWVWR